MFTEQELFSIDNAFNNSFSERKRLLRDAACEQDVVYRVERNNVIILELLPDFGDASTMVASEVAKATFIRSKDYWRIYWLRRNLNWEKYPPRAKVKRIKTFFDIITRDKYHCFFG